MSVLHGAMATGGTQAPDALTALRIDAAGSQDKQPGAADGGVPHQEGTSGCAACCAFNTAQ